jgi:hypothetical protein
MPVGYVNNPLAEVLTVDEYRTRQATLQDAYNASYVGRSNYLRFRKKEIAEYIKGWEFTKTTEGLVFNGVRIPLDTLIIARVCLVNHVKERLTATDFPMYLRSMDSGFLEITNGAVLDDLALAIGERVVFINRAVNSFIVRLGAATTDEQLDSLIADLIL